MKSPLEVAMNAEQTALQTIERSPRMPTLTSGPLVLLAMIGTVALAIAPALSNPTASMPTVSFTSAQASTGEGIYQSSCAMCHGANLDGAAGPALAGANAEDLRSKHFTVSDVFTLMTTEMPLNAPATLTHDQYVAIMAYVLLRNGMKPGSKELTYGDAIKSKAPL